MLLQVEIPTKPFPTRFAGEGLLVVVRVHVKGQVVDLVERFITDDTLERLFPAVGQLVILIVSLLVETFPAVFANEGFVAVVNADVRVQGGRAVERFATGATLVRFFGSVDNLVATKGRRLAKPFPTNFADEGSRPRVDGHVSRQVVVGVEHFAALETGEGLVDTGF